MEVDTIPASTVTSGMAMPSSPFARRSLVVGDLVVGDLVLGDLVGGTGRRCRRFADVTRVVRNGRRGTPSSGRSVLITVGGVVRREPRRRPIRRPAPGPIR